MNPGVFTISLLNGVSYGLLLFMLSSGPHADLQHDGRAQLRPHQLLHAGRYFAYASPTIGFWPARRAPSLCVGLLGAAFERYSCAGCKVRPCARLLVTFGLSYLILELVQLVWGRPRCLRPAEQLQGPLFTLYGTQFPSRRPASSCWWRC